MPDDEEAVEGEQERIIQAEMPEVPEEEPVAGEPGSQQNCVLV
jgi:hypothetical protein